MNDENAVSVEQLSEAMRRWVELKQEMIELEKVIMPAVLSGEQTVSAWGMKAKYSGGRGAYNWQAISVSVAAPQEVIDSKTVTKIVIDWKSVAEAVGYPADVKDANYTPGNPSVTLELVGLL